MSPVMMPFPKPCRHFELMEADERTLRLMEADCANHPLSDAAAVTARLQAALAADPAADQLRTQLQLFDSEGTGRVAISDLQVSRLIAWAVSGGQFPPWPHTWLHGQGGAVCAAKAGSWPPETQTPRGHARHRPPLHMPAMHKRLGGQNVKFRGVQQRAVSSLCSKFLQTSAAAACIQQSQPALSYSALHLCRPH